jgi:hypothetical protein
MAKFRAQEARVYPTFGITVDAGDVVELPEDTDAAGLVKFTEKVVEKTAVPKESE